MNYLLVFLVFVISPSFATSATSATSLDKVNQKSWAHGAADCKSNKDPAIDVLQFNEATFILRQNKCVHFEAPFIYVLFGNSTVFVQDTGATADDDKFPLYRTVQSLVTQWQKSHHNENLKILVTHSHSHSDHTAADVQFLDQPGVTLIEPNAEAVRQYFGFTDWPNGFATVDLGERTLTFMPTPGHQDESVTVYDSQTQWLLSGDNIYPGRLYIKNWRAYKSSIQRLVEFSKTHEISAIMGTHIEMSNVPGEDYPIGSTYQPNEASLALPLETLMSLNHSLQQMGNKPQKKSMDQFVIYPVSMFQRILGGALKWLGIS